ncbi:MAG: tetratricopeptide repeat protein, partial [Parachlamydia sp.]|nr:tetratricopeptide repeat protein [Parachlamydia sp.]
MMLPSQPAGSPLSRQSNGASSDSVSPLSPPATIQTTSQVALALLPNLKPPAPFIPLERSMQFPADNPTTSITLRKLNLKKYATNEFDTEKYRREKLEEIQNPNWSSDSTVRRVFQDVKKEIKTQTSKSSRKNSQSPAPASPVPHHTSSSASKEQLRLAMASIFGCDVRVIEKMVLPLEDLVFLSPESCSAALGSVLFITCKAMLSCIVPCLQKLAPEQPYAMDLAYCKLEDNALLELIKVIQLTPDKPMIRVGRLLNPIEQCEMEKRVLELVKRISIKKEERYGYPWYEKEVKFCFEPFYTVCSESTQKTALNGDRTEPLHLMETYYRQVLVVQSEYKVKDSDALTAVSTTLGVSVVGLPIAYYMIKRDNIDLGTIELLREVYTREGFEHHPSANKRMYANPSISASQPALAVAAVAAPMGIAAAPPSIPPKPNLYRKPLPPAPKKAAASTSSSTATPGGDSVDLSGLSWKERGEAHLRRGEPDRAYEAFTKALEEA